MSQYLSQTEYNQVNNLIDQQQFIASHLTGGYIQQQPQLIPQQDSQPRQPISPTDHFLQNNVSGRSKTANMQRFHSDPGTYHRMPVSAGGGLRSSKSLPRPSQTPAIRKHRRAISAASPHTVVVADTSAEQQMVIPPHTAGYTLPVISKNSMMKTDENGNYIYTEKPDNGDVTSTLVENDDLGLSQLDLNSRGCASLDLQSGTAGRTNKHTPLSQVLEVFQCQPVKSIFAKKNSWQIVVSDSVNLCH